MDLVPGGPNASMHTKRRNNPAAEAALAADLFTATSGKLENIKKIMVLAPLGLVILTLQLLLTVLRND